MRVCKIRNGFTLTEILIVVAIIGILSSVLIVSVGSYWDKTRELGAWSDFASIREAVRVVMNENAGIGSQKDSETIQSVVTRMNDYLDANMKLVYYNDSNFSNGILANSIRSAKLDPWKGEYSVYLYRGNTRSTVDDGTNGRCDRALGGSVNYIKIQMLDGK